jgi:hypothetical protein
MDETATSSQGKKADPSGSKESVSSAFLNKINEEDL